MPRLLSPFEIGELSIPGIWSSGFREDNLNPIEGGGGRSAPPITYLRIRACIYIYTLQFFLTIPHFE